MKFGLGDSDIMYIKNAIDKLTEINKAIIFGSRAMGNYKPGSDVDIAIMGENITFNTVSRLHAMLEEESPMPYFFDIIDYTHLTHKELREHIDSAGKIIYIRNRASRKT